MTAARGSLVWRPAVAGLVLVLVLACGFDNPSSVEDLGEVHLSFG
jgi:hypothetical protein